MNQHNKFQVHYIMYITREFPISYGYNRVSYGRVLSRRYSRRRVPVAVDFQSPLACSRRRIAVTRIYVPRALYGATDETPAKAERCAGRRRGDESSERRVLPVREGRRFAIPSRPRSPGTYR